MEENICKQSSGQRINLQTIQRAQAAQLKKKKKTLKRQSKTGKTQAFLQRRHTDGQEAREKMLNITKYQRNANQNYSEIPLHTSQNVNIKKSTNKKKGKDNKKKFTNNK